MDAAFSTYFASPLALIILSYLAAVAKVKTQGENEEFSSIIQQMSTY